MNIKESITAGENTVKRSYLYRNDPTVILYNKEIQNSTKYTKRNTNINERTKKRHYRMPFFVYLKTYLCTRPEPSPPARVSTSSLVTRLKSPGIVCFNAEAATANSRAAFISLPSARPQIRPPAKESPPPTRSTIGAMWYFLDDRIHHLHLSKCKLTNRYQKLT